MIQKETLTQAISATPIQKVFSSNFLSEYKNVIGVFAKVISGTYTNGRIKISNGISDIIKYLPLDVLTADRSEINAPFFFFPIFTPAQNKRFDITFEADAVASAVEIDFNFELTNEDLKPVRAFNFQTESLAIAGASAYEKITVVTDPDFEFVKGILLISKSSAYLDCYDVAVRKDDGTAIISNAGAYMFDNSKKLPTDQRFFEVEIPAGGKNIVVEIKKVRAQVVDDTIQIVLLLDKKF